MSIIFTQEIYHQEKDRVRNNLIVGIKSFDNLDGDMSMFTQDDFCVIAGSTGTGKSTLALYMAFNIALNGKKVVFFNVETDNKMIQENIVKLGFSNNLDIINNGLTIITERVLNLAQVEAYVQMNKPDVIFIDLFNVLCADLPDGFQKNKVVHDIAVKFSLFPEKYNCAVYVTEQIKERERLKGKPMIKDIAGSSALTTKATKIVVCYSWIADNMDKYHKLGSDVLMVTNVLQIMILKDRFARPTTKSTLIKLFKNDGFFELNDLEQEQYFDVVSKKWM